MNSVAATASHHMQANTVSGTRAPMMGIAAGTNSQHPWIGRPPHRGQ